MVLFHMTVIFIVLNWCSHFFQPQGALIFPNNMTFLNTAGTILACIILLFFNMLHFFSVLFHRCVSFDVQCSDISDSIVRLLHKHRRMKLSVESCIQTGNILFRFLNCHDRSIRELPSCHLDVSAVYIETVSNILNYSIKESLHVSLVTLSVI